MSRPQSPALTEAELRIMNVLWEKGAGTVQEVLSGLAKKPPLAYNSVLTTIRILEKKGYLKHVKRDRAHVYIPMVGRNEAKRSEIRRLVSRFFRDSHEQLIMNILEDRSVTEQEVQRLRELLARTKPS